MFSVCFSEKTYYSEMADNSITLTSCKAKERSSSLKLSSLFKKVAIDLSSFFPRIKSLKKSSRKVEAQPFSPLKTVSITQNSVKLESVDSNLESGIQLQSKAQQLLECKQIYWIPHPVYQNDSGPLPHDAVQVYDFYGSKRLAFFFKERVNEAIENGSHNAFLLWLNEANTMDKKAAIDTLLDNQQFAFMNCADFVFTTLYLADLIKHADVLKLYEKHRFATYHKQNSDQWYGVAIDYFHTFDPQTSQGNPGDIILCFDEEKKPVHVMIEADGKTAFSLWCTPNYFVSKIDLREVESLSQRGSSKIVEMKRCPLALFLKHVQNCSLMM